MYLQNPPPNTYHTSLTMDLVVLVRDVYYTFIFV
nr:MAG TPA: hypothetical protein [Bacteriophage sp.]DAP45183.1 MAG TPA: hypothetical protein [Caudoviricetes sp.]